jgi:hypothetical protein
MTNRSQNPLPCFPRNRAQAGREDGATTRYIVTLTRIVNYEVRIEANSPEEAMDRARSVDGSILNADHMVGEELTADFATQEE